MKQTEPLLAPRRSEILGGILYWPMFLLGTPLIAAFFVALFWSSADDMRNAAHINFVFSVLNAAILCILFRRMLKDGFARLLGRGWRLFPDLGRGILIYFALAYAAGYVIDLLTQVFGVENVNQNQDLIEQITRVLPTLVIVDACLLAPIAEELLTRALIFGGLYHRSRILAYAVSMLVFSLAHCIVAIPSQPIGVTVINIVTYLPAGFVFAWVYERSGTVWTSVFLHSLVNIIAMLVQAGGI